MSIIFVTACHILCRLESGTLPFLDIISLLTGFDVLHELVGSMQAVQNHTHQLTDYVLREMRKCVHHNGQPVVQLYTNVSPNVSADVSSRLHGAIVTFNILQADGTYLGYSQVGHFVFLAKYHPVFLHAQ